MHYDYVHVAFHDDCLVLAADSLARFIQAIQQAALVKQVRLRRIHKFGNNIRVEDAPAKSGHVAAGASRMGNISRWRKRS